jgi:ABC-2 type transport system permease protein
MRDIGGPSAFGGSWSRFRHLTWITAVNAFRTRYENTTFGYLWALIRPLMLFAVLYVVFTRVIRFGGEVENYPMLLLFNIVLFQFFAEGTGRAMRSLIAGGNVIRRLELPRLVLPLGAILTVFFSLVLNLLVVFTWFLFYGVEPRTTWLFLPVIILVLVCLTAGTGLLLASLIPGFRDVLEMWPPLTRMLFYTSPIIFPIEFVPEGVLRDIASINPLTPILIQARIWLIDPDAPGWRESAGGPLAEIAPFLVFSAVCIGGSYLFVRRARRAAEAV